MITEHPQQEVLVVESMEAVSLYGLWRNNRSPFLWRWMFCWRCSETVVMGWDIRTWRRAQLSQRTACRWDTRSSAYHTWCRWPCDHTPGGRSRSRSPCRSCTGCHPRWSAGPSPHLEEDRGEESEKKAKEQDIPYRSEWRRAMMMSSPEEVEQTGTASERAH